jgi:hypothetical protein
MDSTSILSGVNDFDFFIGSWKVSHRKLKKRLAKSSDWEEFSGLSVCRKILNGHGNFDDNQLETPGKSYFAATMRTFNSETGLWSIWWLDGRNSDQLDAPMQGLFTDGVGTFYADEIFEGKKIKVRFLWTLPTSITPRWEQAFSEDGGETWETNWVMDFLSDK